jgi:hypothetical protein
MQQKQIEPILALLKKFRTRMLVHDTLAFVQTYVWIAASAMLAVQLIGRVFPISNLLVYTLIPAGVFLLLTLLRILFIPKSNLSVAWRVDQNLQLKERISTVIALDAAAPSINPEAVDLIEKQKKDAFDTLKNTNPRNSFRAAFLRRRVLSAFLIISAALILTLIPNPMDEILRTREAVTQAAQEQAEEIEELKEEIEAKEQLSEEEKEALLRELEALAAQLRENPGDQAEALEDISQLEQSLLERLDPDAQFKQAALESISEQLAALAKQTSDLPEEISGMEEALESLSEVVGEMSEADRKELSANLRNLASQAAQAGAASLAEALSAMSQAAQNGSIEGVQQAGEQTQQAMEESLTQISDQQSLEAALAQLQNSRQALSQAGQSGTAAQNPGSGQSSQGQSQSQGQGQGQGQGAAAGAGGGTQADSLPPSTGSGQAGAPQGTDDSGAAGTLSEQVFAPWERLQGENDPLSISGQDTGQGETQVNEQDQPLPGINTPSIVPYQQVFQTYVDTAYQTLEESYIPPSLKAYILAYFSQLEP